MAEAINAITSFPAGCGRLHMQCLWMAPAPAAQVVMHDLASADSRDFSRSACFESKAPTCLAFLLLNLPTLAGYGTSGAPAGGAGGQVRVAAVQGTTARGCAKHRWLARSSFTFAVALAQGCRLPCAASIADRRPPSMLCMLRSRSCCR